MIFSNRLKGLALTLLLAVVSLQLQAQDKMLTMEDAIINPALQPENLRQLSWVAGSDNFTYVKDNNLLRGAAKSTKHATIVTLDKLNSALQAAGSKEIKSFPAVQWKDANTMVLNLQGKIFNYDL